jgi:MYXO-CTERM domain-containing protein
MIRRYMILIGLLLTSPAAHAGAGFTIPKNPVTPTIDGKCDLATEYKYAVTSQTLKSSTNADDGKVYIVHDGVYIYVCVQVSGSHVDRSVVVYLDTNNGNETFAMTEDLALKVKIVTNTMTAYRGSGVANGYVADATIKGWDASAVVGSSGGLDGAEFKIPFSLTGALCQKKFGMAVYRLWGTYIGDDAGWPSGKYFDSPVTWETIIGLDGWTMPDADGDGIGDACDTSDSAVQKPDTGVTQDVSAPLVDKSLKGDSSITTPDKKIDMKRDSKLSPDTRTTTSSDSGCSCTTAPAPMPLGIGLLLVCFVIMLRGRR